MFDAFLTRPAALTVPAYTPPAPVAPAGADNVNSAVSIFLWGVGIAGFIGLVVIALMMFFADEHKLGKVGSRLGMWFAGATVVGIAGGIVTSMLHI